jgi:hypothetical protein
MFPKHSKNCKNIQIIENLIKSKRVVFMEKQD